MVTTSDLMATDFASYYAQAQGGNPYNAVQVPNQPGFTPSTPRRPGSTSPDISSLPGLPGNDPLDFGSVFGGGKPKSIASGGREFYKGNAILNAYNWLLPYTAQTTERGAQAFGDIYRRQGAQNKAYELAQFKDYAPQYADAILNADPRQAKMLQLYNDALSSNQGQAQSYVDRLKSQLDNPMNAASARDIMQSSLGQAGVSGFGPQARDAALAYIRTGLQGQQLQQQRENTYMQALGSLGQSTNALQGGVQANKSVLGDPFLAFAGRPGQPAGANVNSPDYSGFNNDLFSYSVNGDIQRANMAAANSASNKQMIGSIVGGLLSSAGSIGRALCWVAREVYGEDSPRWQDFRSWLIFKAPMAWVVRYARHGEKFAQWLKDKPEARARVLRWMETQMAA